MGSHRRCYFRRAEEYLGCPIISSMETVSLGYVEDEGKKLEVRIDKNAIESM